MLHDALLALQAVVTKTADFTSAAFNLAKCSGSGLRSRFTYFAQVMYRAAADAAAPANSTVQFNIEHSDDGVTWYLLSSGADQVITLNTVAKEGEVFLPINTDKKYVRLVLDVTNGDGGSTPTITYEAYLGTAKP